MKSNILFSGIVIFFLMGAAQAAEMRFIPLDRSKVVRTIPLSAKTPVSSPQAVKIIREQPLRGVQTTLATPGQAGNLLDLYPNATLPATSVIQ